MRIYCALDGRKDRNRHDGYTLPLKSMETLNFLLQQPKFGGREEEAEKQQRDSAMGSGESSHGGDTTAITMTVKSERGVKGDKRAAQNRKGDGKVADNFREIRFEMRKNTEVMRTV